MKHRLDFVVCFFGPEFLRKLSSIAFCCGSTVAALLTCFLSLSPSLSLSLTTKFLLRSSRPPVTMIRSIPAYLVVISLIRGTQIILSWVLFVKVLLFNVPFQFEVFCRSNAVGQVNYDASFPFAWLTVQAPNDCSDQAANVTTYLWTGKFDG